MNTRTPYPAPSVASPELYGSGNAVLNEGVGLGVLPEVECSCCGNTIRAGGNRVINLKTLGRLSRRVGGELTGVICIPCSDRIKKTKSWAVSSGVSVMTYTAKRIKGGFIPPDIQSVFENVSAAKEAVESNIKKQIRAIETLNNEYSALQSAWLKARQAYADHLWATYPERRKRANKAISQQELRIMVFSRDGYACKRCTNKTHLQVDHITPVISGGTDEPDNLQTLCRSCNASKGGRI